MGRLSAFPVALALGAASAMALASCGGGSSADLLPGTTANQINSNLGQVQKLVDEGDCVGAEDGVAAVKIEVEDLNGVDRKLKAALEEGATRLSEVVTECEETSSEETEPTRQSDVEAEELEREEQEAGEKADQAKEKAEKHGKEPSAEATEPNEEEGGNLPPQSNGKGKAKGHETPPPPAAEPPAEEESPSGGVGPAVGVGE